MSLFNLFRGERKNADNSYVNDELFLLIKELQFLFSQRNKKIKLNQEEVQNINKSISLFFQYIDINDPEHLAYICSKLRLVSCNEKGFFLEALQESFDKDELESIQSAIDFRLRAVKYIYRYYHTVLTRDQKEEIKKGLTYFNLEY